MIAAEQIRLLDAKELSVASAYSSSDDFEAIKAKIKTLLEGQAHFTVTGAAQKKLQNVVQHREERKREMLIKISRSRPCCNTRVERSFIIDNGDLLVYRDHHPNAKVKAIYHLKDATCFYEEPRTASLPKWQEGYQMRLRVICTDREKAGKSPLYLYSKDEAKIHRWKRAFTLAKVLVSENDRRALKVSIGRATSGALQKAWDSLAMYYGEYAKTKALVKNMAMRLMKVDYSRGWMKFKLVYRKKMDEQQRRKDQQIWAARFMSEKLTKLGKQKAKEIDDVREGVITRIQQRFRSYREDMIFDRTYPLTSSMMARVQSAKVGQVVDYSMQTVSADDVCHLSLKVNAEKTKDADAKGDSNDTNGPSANNDKAAQLNQAFEKWSKDKDVLRSTSPGYSALQDGNLSLQTVLVYASDNLSALFFADQQPTDGIAVLNKTDWSKFINMDRISSVVLHSEPRPGAGHTSGDAGVWCTINGPRVAWDRRLAMQSGKKEVFGAETNLTVGSAIAQAKPLHWLQLEGRLGRVTLSEKKVEGEEPPPFKFKTKAVLHLLGWSYESKEVEGNNPDYELTVKGAVPVSSEKFVSLDDSEVGVEIFQVIPEEEVEVPGNKHPGDTFTKEISGKLYHILVPEGAKPGSIFKVALPSSDNAKAVDVSVKYPDDKKQTSWTQKVLGRDYQLSAPERKEGDPGEMTISVAEASDPAVKEGRRLLYAGCESLTTLFNVTPKEDGSPLDFFKVLTSGAKPEQLQLFEPGALVEIKSDEKDKDKTMEVKVTADLGIACKGLPDKPAETVTGAENPSTQSMPCVSPELVGGGVNTTLYSCNRAAWFDPGLGAGKFRPDHVANYVELKLSSLTFPISDKWSDAEAKSMYYVRARVCGVAVTSTALHRPSPVWSKVLPSHLVDPSQIRFEGQQLLLPLPAGCWAGDDPERTEMRKVRIEVVKASYKDSGSVLDFDSFANTAGAAPKNTYSEKVVFKAALTFDNHMLVDMEKQLGLFLTRPDQQVKEVDVFRPTAKSDHATDTQPQGMLSLEFALRDRDQARAVMGQSGHKSALCIGDKAMLVVEEPFLYPKDAADFRKQFCVGDYVKGKKDGQAWRVELREPCLSSEYAESGLGELVPKRPFKQSFIPTFCDDIIPHKYVMPLSEKEFLDKHKPGFFNRILDDMASKASSDHTLPYRSGPNKPVVSHLEHMNRHVPVTILAMYADSGNGATCDVEVTELFVKKWREQKHRKFAFPGKLEKLERKGKGGETLPPRFILKQVPAILLNAVHYSGINVYDALFKTTSDVIQAPPPANEFDPRSYEAAQKGAKKNYLEYKLAAGPLPPDASTSACMYEFNVRVRFPSEYEMYQFVAMVRKCVRVDHYQQASKMIEYQKQTQMTTPQLMRHPGLQKSGGQLDVLLVEARRLQPLQSALNTVLTSDPITLYESWSKGRSDVDPSQSNQMVDANYLPELLGTTDGQAVKGTPEGSSIGTFVNFRMLHNKEVIPYRGTNKQVSPVISGTDSPVWSKLPQLESVGGWTFRTGIIDPEKYPKLLIEFEVMKAGMSPSRIGVIQLPVTEEQFLTNPNQMFKNLWLPLVSVKDGELTPNITGEIHVLTRWLPVEMKQVFADGQEKMQLSVRSMFLKDIWSKVCQPRIREPIYGVEAMYHALTYNPNLVRLRDKEGTKSPETLKDNARRHVEELSNCVPYLECLERRQLNAWNIFQAELQDRGYEGRSIGELRLLWQQNEDQAMLNKLQQLVLRGVPSALRPQVWAELTLASRVATQDGATYGRDPEASGEDAAEQEYRHLLERGLPQLSDAMLQLQEDAVLLAGWESSTPPLPEAMELHLKRIKNAKNVVTALLAVEDSGIAYCESLLVLAFFLLLPQGYKEVASSSYTGEGLTQPTESSVFWLLYTLICTRTNGVYREYYGMPLQPEQDPSLSELVGGSGAIQDVHLLECAVAYHDKELYQCMSAMGFDLSTVFYGAFMRWFATYMPTASVFRLWDALLLQSSNPKAQPHARANLIDLGFATLRAKRTELMSCQSALEMRSIVLGFLASLYDTGTVIDLIHSAHCFLWGGGGFSSGKVAVLWTKREELFTGANTITKNQNRVLKRIAHEGVVGRQAAQEHGVSTRQLVKEVIPAVRVSLESARKRGEPKHWAMHRPLPLADRTAMQEKGTGAAAVFGAHPPVRRYPFRVGPSSSSGARTIPGMEPLDVSQSELLHAMQREAPSWAGDAVTLWQTFSDQPHRLLGTAVLNGPPAAGAPAPVLSEHWFKSMLAKASDTLGMTPASDPNLVLDKDTPKTSDAGDQPLDHVSLNDIFAALICSSRGTVSEKAAALFDLYSYTAPRGNEHHITPLNRVSKRAAASALADGGDLGRVLAPTWGEDPEEKEAKQNNVLKFTVYTSYPADAVLGHVLIPSLSPYVSSGAAEPVARSYNIWGRKPRAANSTSASNPNMNNNAGGGDQNRLVCLGEINMALQWREASPKTPHQGQLTILVKYVKFQGYYIMEDYNVNPRITVSLSQETTGTDRNWVDIKRWDPRGVFKKDAVSVTKTGAFGGVIEFERTMKKKTYGGGKELGQWIRHGDGQGYSPGEGKESGKWEWNKTWGLQHSPPDLRVHPDFVQNESRRNTIDMTGVRLIVSQLLQRCLLNMSNRQALLIADSIFNRAGAVPGIAQAVLVKASNADFGVYADKRTWLCEHGLAQILEKLTTAHPYVDVTKEIVLEHERQVSCNGGNINLFASSYMKEKLNLSAMGISDPYVKDNKVLFIRYIRAGDGQRCTQAVAVDPDGSVTPDSEVKMDLLATEGPSDEELVPGKRVYLTYEGAKKNNVNSAEKTCFKRISTSTTADNKPRTVVHLELPNVLDSLDIPKEIMVDLVDLWEWERIPLKQVYLADGTKVKVKKVSSTALRTSVDVELLEKREVTLNPEHIQVKMDLRATAGQSQQALAPGTRVHLTNEGARKHNVAATEKALVQKAFNDEQKTIVHLQLPDKKDRSGAAKEIQVDLVDISAKEWESVPSKQVYLTSQGANKLDISDSTVAKVTVTVKKVSTTSDQKTSVLVELLVPKEKAVDPADLQVKLDPSAEGAEDLAPGRRVYLSYESARKHNVDSNDKTYVKKVAAAKDNKNKTMVYLELPDEKEVAVEPVEIQTKPPSWSMSRVSKQEFIACFTASPLLSESIRRLGCTTHELHETRPIPLEVTIMDPHHDDVFQELEESVNIGQSLLIEVWDSDFMGMDFLGEAWLPPLSEFGPRPKDIVLPLQPVNYSPDSENGPSRHDPKKDLKDDGTNPNMKVTGDIFLTVSWNYPTIEGRGLDVDVETWLAMLEQKYIKAKTLKPGELTKYQEPIIDNYRTVRNIREQMVENKAPFQLKANFFSTLHITDSRVKKILNDWFKDQLTETIQGRGLQQEHKHSGILTVRIERAERLRRADAKKLMDCDPKALLWVRNDVQGSWRKKPLMQTGRISNNRNPRWGFEDSKTIFTGSFEAQRKPPPEGWQAQAGQLLTTRATQRKRQDQRNLAALKRFGAKGLKIEFGVSATAAQSAATEATEGSNHSVPVFLTDTIRDFKEKLTDACRKESEFWRNRGDADVATKFSDIEMNHRYLVMAHVPSSKVVQMQKKNLQSTSEYAHAQQLSLNDPMSWVPLDFENAFSQYVSKFGFGHGKVSLRVVEGTEGYKAVNPHYQAWLEDKRTTTLKDLNEVDRCFGWAKFVHKVDGKQTAASSSSAESRVEKVHRPEPGESIEWRPAIIRKARDGRNDDYQNRDYFRVEWVHGTPGNSDNNYLLHKSAVLLAPRAPKIDDNTHFRHLEVLKQAKRLRSSGKSDWEIEAYLNKLLEKQLEEREAQRPREEKSEEKPPRLTIDLIRAYLQREEGKAIGKAY